MSTAQVQSHDASARVAQLATKLEVVVIPVSDVDRAKAFYVGLGWRLDADFADGDGVPDRPAHASWFGVLDPVRRADDDRRARVGAEHVPDRRRRRGGARRAHGARRRGRRGLPRRIHRRPVRSRSAVSPAAPRTAPPTAPSRPSAIPTATAGSSRRSRSDFPAASIRRRRYASIADLAGALRRAAAAHGEHEARIGAGRRELARLVRRVHGGRGGRNRAAEVSDPRVLVPEAGALGEHRPGAPEDAGAAGCAELARLAAQRDGDRADRGDGARLGRRLLRRLRRQRRRPGDQPRTSAPA